MVTLEVRGQAINFYGSPTSCLGHSANTAFQKRAGTPAMLDTWDAINEEVRFSFRRKGRGCVSIGRCL